MRTGPPEPLQPALNPAWVAFWDLVRSTARGLPDARRPTGDKTGGPLTADTTDGEDALPSTGIVPAPPVNIY